MTTSINEDICSLKLQVAHHEGHLERVATITGLTDVSLPKSYGLKHLETRGKQKQLERDRLLHIQKSDELLARDLKHIAEEVRPQPAPLTLDSANAKVRIAELKYLEKNNRHMLAGLGKTVSMMPTKEELDMHNARNLKQKKLLSRKFFGSLPNPNCNGEKVKRITQEAIDAKPQWKGVGSQYDGNSSLDPIDPDDYVLHDEDRSVAAGSTGRDAQLRNRARRKRPETPKSKPTYNHLKPKIKKIEFEIINMP
mmetsp:Transcript_10987/g.17932  ORF Transcript_10987/g.17932 Transcript_10987/m.17932 type:complete len:253 (+) Transcript_10987:126-884(+)|eukprot:CAMPEP_0114418514 /NCGR_PEP_ID=MMETSP0103-20121206/3537_1 /TAXON_ID=37642 ORGANISM="Paraphysomonas imperforata, Strain PA2" /NCGR_SAMPLE_ID=MMETSP0103 /ASSEMBLY_ACC=CAM_ASM_000201 /LENGTH=252 /DNA_ID=CAMNT_0001586877 /DNA_START=126 /DNA_END=884 /DNA_ORIENTATION=+